MGTGGWTREQVEALGPDTASVTIGRALARGSGWSEEGHTDRAVWGSCQGSGRTPYRTTVDLDGPAYTCSCPSRKLPCKHTIGLLLRFVTDQVPARSEPDEHAAVWLAERDNRSAGGAARPSSASTTGTPEAAEARALAASKRADQRVARVSAGLGDLQRWIEDQARAGLAGLPAKGYAAFEPTAARMVDAQAPGIASWLRGLPAVLASGPSWPERLLEDLSLLRLLALAHERLPELDVVDPALAASVRTHVGYPVSKESVLATPPVRDRWTVDGSRDTVTGNLYQRTVWLRGRDSGRYAVMLAFSPGSPVVDATLVPGRSADLDLHFYPAARPLRALVAEDESRSWGEALPPPSGSVAGALELVADALARDPWARSQPAWVTGVPMRRGGSWFIADEVGDTVPLLAGLDEPWRLLSGSGGRAGPVLLDWSPAGWVPIAVADDRGVRAA
ncbi:MAG: SWIM zinc finger family protein [Nostocoides sp.]